MLIIDSISITLSSGKGWRLQLWSALLVLSGLFLAAAALPASSAPRLKLTVDGPGVFSVSRAELEGVAQGEVSLEGARWTVWNGERPVAAWADRADASWSRLLVAVPSSHFERELVDESRLVALRLEPSADPLPIWPARGTVTSPDPVRHRLVLEDDQLRVALVTKDVVVSGVDTLWFWAVVSQRGSATLTVNLDPFSDLRSDRIVRFDLSVRVLGWTYPELPHGVAQHQVDVTLNGQRIGSAAWDGRRLQTIHLSDVDAQKLKPRGNLLKIEVPERFLPGEGDDAAVSQPIIDLSYVDRIEIVYDTVAGADRVAEPATPHVVSIEASPALQVADARVFPTMPNSSVESLREVEAFVVRDGAWQRPLRLAAWRAEPEPLGPVDYLAVGPEILLESVEPLLAMHRQRGLRTAAVSIEDLVDGHGNGLHTVTGVRDYLLAEHRRHGALQYVLLVGDADWWARGEQPTIETDAVTREPAAGTADLVPTGTYLSPYGPAASDHVYVAESGAETRPRFAVGRLPVRTVSELEAAVGKILKAYKTPRAKPSEVLLLSGLDSPSQARLERLSRRLQSAEPQPGVDEPGVDAAVDVQRLAWSSEVALDAQLVDALRREPSVVVFAGHGSRHLWGLGGPQVMDASSRFEFEDLRGVEPPTRWPVILSISCATAPFDHPSSGSLGEAMVLDPARGAAAFIGASATLYTPPRFSLELLDGLLWQRRTLGDALVEAKGVADNPHVSHLYNLLGDPAMPLWP